MTAFTPLTPQAWVAAVTFSSPLLAKPDNITVPLRVSTLMAAASTVLFSTKRLFTAAVMAVDLATRHVEGPTGISLFIPGEGEGEGER